MKAGMQYRMKKLCAKTQQVVDKTAFRQNRENCPQSSTGAPQLFRRPKATQVARAKALSELSRISASFIYYY
jgi:hypothetical protein